MEYILIIGLVVGFILLFISFKIHKQWMENTIDHKIKVHNVSIHTVINACDKVVTQCQKNNDSAKEYVEKSSIQVKRMEQL